MQEHDALDRAWALESKHLGLYLSPPLAAQISLDEFFLYFDSQSSAL